MTTNNHPAHGPVSLDRLHQISEILSKASAQSDGGNLGYAMADAVKVIDGAIAAFGAEAIGEVIEQQSGVMMDGLVISEKPTYRNIKGIHKMKMMPLGTKFYTVPPAPVVPEWTNEQCLEFLSIAFRHAEIKGDLELDDIRLGMKMVNESRAAMLQAGFHHRPLLTPELKWRAEQCECVSMCLDDNGVPKNEGDEELSLWGRVQKYAAMLQAGNSPVTPDGLLDCGENCWSCGKYFTYEQHSECDGYCPHCNSPVDLDDEEEQPSKVVPTEPTEEMISNAWREAIGKCDHETIKCIYATMLAAAPQQEVKSALEHGMQRYAGAMQKLSEGDK